MAIKEYQGTPQRPGRKGYVTKVFTGPDIRKARGMLDQQAKESSAKKREKALKEDTVRVRNAAGEVRYVSEKAAQQITTMQRANRRLYPKGPPSSRISVSMRAYLKNGKVVREGDPDY